MFALRVAQGRVWVLHSLCVFFIFGCGGDEGGDSPAVDASIIDGSVSSDAERTSDEGGLSPDAEARVDAELEADAALPDGEPPVCQPGDTRGCPEYPDCAGGLQTCQDGDWGPCELGEDVCDGVDNDCDGILDETFVSEDTTCGLGICAAVGTTQCENGEVVDSCAVGPAAENDASCNRLDDDCDGQVDEAFVVEVTTCGLGACFAEGRRICEDGEVLDTCVQAAMPVDEVCDGIDNDCNGVVDDELGVTTCGEGPCRHEQPNCVDGVAVDCDPMLGASPEVCDDIDNDCDGVVDDGLDFEDYYVDPDGDGFYGPMVTETQPSCASWFAAGQVEDGVYSIDPDGPDGEGGALQVYCDMTTDGGGWTRVFFHDVAGGYWAGDADSIERSVDDPMANRYSILSRLDAFRSSDGFFDFRINWPDSRVEGRNIWRQSSNPAVDAIADYEGVEIDYEQAGWGGLEANRFNDGSLVDGTVGEPFWFYALGATEPWGVPPGIASYGPSAPRVALWVRPDDSVLRANPSPVSACLPLEGYVQIGGDCNAEVATAFPDAEEVCDGIDNDCDGEAEENLEFVFWYPDRDGDGRGVSGGSSCSSLLAQGEESDGVYLIQPDGPDGVSLNVYCDMTTDEGGWTRVFYHDTAAGYWAGDADALERNADDPLAGRYSILSHLESLRSSDDYFDFRLNWPDTVTGGRNIWRQTSNPTTDPIANYEAVAIDHTGNYWGGIEYNRFNNSSFIDGSANHAYWWYAIGAHQNFQGGVPGSNRSVPRVALWVRPDDDRTAGTRIWACTQPDGYSDISGDCDDTDPGLSPDLEDLCDGIDNDCDGVVDNDCPFGDIQLTDAPQDLHFYPRDLANNRCGFTVAADYEGVANELRVVVQLNDEVMSEFQSEPDSAQVFVQLEAGLHRYNIQVYWGDGTGGWRIKSEFEDIVCGDVFLIDGQSNSVARDYHNERLGDLERNPFVRSYGSAVNNGNVSSNTDFVLAVADAGGSTGSIGQWGMRLANVIKNTQDIPVLMINGAVGGTRVDQHQRDANNPTNLGTIYGRLLWRVQQAGVADHVRAIFWHQGESDGALEYDEYLARWTSMYESWLLDYPNVEGVFPFQVRAGCGNPTWNRNVHRELPGLLDRVLASMSTTGVDGHDRCHFYNATYVEWAERMARLVRRDLYDDTPEGNIDAPSPQSARWTGEQELTIEFGATGGGLILQDGAGQFFSLGDGAAIESVRVEDTSIVITTSVVSVAATVSFVDTPGDIPWLINDLGIGAFVFYDFPIEP